jgi:hypothetical protein
LGAPPGNRPPPATPAVVAGVAAASTILQPSDARAAFDLAQRAARLATGLDDVTRGRAARAAGMGAMWIQPELVLPALHEALDRFGDREPWETALTMPHPGHRPVERSARPGAVERSALPPRG